MKELLKKIYYYGVMGASMLILVMSSCIIAYYLLQFKLFIYGGTFYHDPVLDNTEKLLSMGILGALAGILLYSFAYNPWMDLIHYVLYERKSKRMKGGAKEI